MMNHADHFAYYASSDHSAPARLRELLHDLRMDDLNDPAMHALVATALASYTRCAFRSNALYQYISIAYANYPALSADIFIDEGMVQLLRNLEKILACPEERRLGYAFTILQRAALMLLRSERRHAGSTTPLSFIKGADERFSDDSNMEAEHAESEYMQHHLFGDVRKVLMAFAPEDRHLLVTKWLKITYQEYGSACEKGLTEAQQKMLVTFGLSDLPMQPASRRDPVWVSQRRSKISSQFKKRLLALSAA